MGQNTINKFNTDVQNMASTIMTQAMCAEKGIDYNQLMQAAQMAHLQGILQQEEQRRIMRAVANYYGTQNTTGFLGKLKQAMVGDQYDNMPIGNMFLQAAVQQTAQQTIQQTMPIPAQPEIIPAPAKNDTDVRVDKLEKEVASIKNDVSEIKDLLGALANSITSNKDIPLK